MKYSFKKTFKHYLFAFFLTVCAGLSLGFHQRDDKIIVAYVTSWSNVLPDPSYFTHINYAFGHVNSSFDGISIDNENRLKEIIALKKTHPNLKVLLSIGGWGSGRFSEMASDENLRNSFVRHCVVIIEKFNLDGIDIDWEYPTISSAGISSSPLDTDNFTLLMRDIRKEIGDKKLLTLATVASGKYINLAAINRYVDYVNIMTYDAGSPPNHHASLFRSEMSGGTTCEEAVAAHINGGIPAEKIVLGIPFYGRGNKKDVKNFIDYKEILVLNGFQEVWDEKAKASYMVNSNGEFVLSFESPRSTQLKCEFSKDKGLLGIMYWDYAGDTEEGTLRKVVYNEIMKY